ncbi:thiamine pyrophosphate-dependent acetolactate synthase large subunit-like protein [Bradyrhizobium sp. LB13.1]
MSKSGKTGNKSVTVKQATLDLLRSFGIKKVFGNPGSTELPFLSDWPDDIDYVLALQEASAVGMADGYAQATRNAGFVNLHSAAGVGNALGNIYTAHRNQTPLVITAGQQARSILPLQAFLFAERASEFPRPYVKYSVEPARPEDVPAAIARAYYTAMQPPCGPTFVSIPVDDWAHAAAAVEARKVSREIGPEPDAMKALVAALASAKHPALVVGPGVDRAGAVDLMVRVAEKAKASVWVSPFSARCSFPERHPQFAGFLHASPAQLSDALREHDLVVVIGAPVFTFHVEGHAAIFDGGATIFQITDDPDAAAVTPVGTSIIATMKPALAMLLDLLPESKRAAPTSRTLPPAPQAADPLPVEFLLHSLSQAMPEGASLVEEAPSHRPAMQKFMPMRGQDSFLHHGKRRPRPLPARRCRHGARQAEQPHGVPDRRRLGDVLHPGAVDRRAAQAAAHDRRHQQFRLRRDAFVQPGDAGAQRAGARAAGDRFRAARRRHGLPCSAGKQGGGAWRGAEARAGVCGDEPCGGGRGFGGAGAVRAEALAARCDFMSSSWRKPGPITPRGSLAKAFHLVLRPRAPVRSRGMGPGLRQDDTEVVVRAPYVPNSSRIFAWILAMPPIQRS